MENLKVEEIKAFVPAKDFEVSKSFYEEIGFSKGSDAGGVAYFYFGDSSFLLQDFYDENHANNFLMHVLVEDIESWHAKITASGVIEKYEVKVSDICEQPWKMFDFTMSDPSGVLWRFGQNI